jgi:quinol monooxygenase YgiN
MAIAVDMTYTVSGMDTYHKACAQLGFADEQHGAPGILFHWVEAVDGGFVVHEVWESEEQFEEFLDGHLEPMSSALGTEQPEVDVRPVASFRRPV